MRLNFVIYSHAQVKLNLINGMISRYILFQAFVTFVISLKKFAVVIFRWALPRRIPFVGLSCRQASVESHGLCLCLLLWL